MYPHYCHHGMGGTCIYCACISFVVLLSLLSAPCCIALFIAIAVQTMWACLHTHYAHTTLVVVIAITAQVVWVLLYTYHAPIAFVVVAITVQMVWTQLCILLSSCVAIEVLDPSTGCEGGKDSG